MWRGTRQDRHGRRRVGVLTAGVTLALVAATTSWACTNFVGKFVVSGNEFGTVVADGEDERDPEGWSWQMKQDIEGHAGASASGGSISVQTDAASNGTTLPASDSDAEFYAGDVGPYHINFINGPAYPTHKNWALDCMTYFTERTTEALSDNTGRTEVEQLGKVLVDADGQISGIATDSDSKYSPTYEETTKSASFALPTASPDLVGESAVCISDKAGYFGNQAPLALI